MAKPYVIRQGDYLAKLAFTMGFSADDVWNDPKNADLKAARHNPNALLPGDILHLPDPRTARSGTLTTGTTNRFTAKTPVVPVVITLLARDNKPRANHRCIVHGLGDPFVRTTDGSGKLSLEVPVTVREVPVMLEDGSTLWLMVGDMDPIETIEGIKKRLTQLGYYTAVSFHSDDVESRRYASAVAAFQRASGVTESGTVDDDTRKALLAAHGA